MFKWLKEKATKAAANQCKLNIKLNTRGLIATANDAAANISASGGSTNEADIRRVLKAQERLREDIVLGLANGLSIENIKNSVITPEIEKFHASDEAKFAIDHVIKTIDIKASSLSPTFAAETTTRFFQGNVKIESFDIETTKFRVIENNSLVSVRNDTHLRLVEDISKISSMPYFEIIAPMGAVEVLEGEIPSVYLHEYSLSHYLTLRKYYAGE